VINFIARKVLISFPFHTNPPAPNLTPSLSLDPRPSTLNTQNSTLNTQNSKLKTQNSKLNGKEWRVNSKSGAISRRNLANPRAITSAVVSDCYARQIWRQVLLDRSLTLVLHPSRRDLTNPRAVTSAVVSGRYTRQI
jgi:hypothetical protein